MFSLKQFSSDAAFLEGISGYVNHGNTKEILELW